MNANNREDWLKQDIVNIIENLSEIDNAIISDKWLDAEKEDSYFEQIQLQIDDAEQENNSCTIQIY